MWQICSLPPWLLCWAWYASERIMDEVLTWPPGSCPGCQRPKGQSEPRGCRSHTGNHFLDQFLFQLGTGCSYYDDLIKSVRLFQKCGLHVLTTLKKYSIKVRHWLQNSSLIRGISAMIKLQQWSGWIWRWITTTAFQSHFNCFDSNQTEA